VKPWIKPWIFHMELLGKPHRYGPKKPVINGMIIPANLIGDLSV
jgi:hypothetical protein